MNNNQTILFFDGVCNLCNAAVDFFVKRDTKKALKYAPLQGVTASKLLSGSLTQELSSVVLYHKGQTYIKSRAILKSLILVGGFYSFLGIFQLLPTSLLDLIYDFIAANRYRIFGKRETCRLPSPEEKSLFLD